MRAHFSGARRLNSACAARSSLASENCSPLGRSATSSCALPTSIPTYTAGCSIEASSLGCADRVLPCAMRPGLAPVPATVRTIDRRWLQRGDSRSSALCPLDDPEAFDLPRRNLSCRTLLEIQGGRHEQACQ